MRNKEEILQDLCYNKIVVVVRADSQEEAYNVSAACIEAGMLSVEVAFTLPTAHTVIEKLKAKYSGSGAVVGAGTVLDSQTARIAILSGADFIVGPSLDEPTVRLCNTYKTAVIPGAMTPTEVVATLSSGADMVKVFPIDLLGLNYIKALKGPFPQAKFMVTGNVSLSQIESFLRAGASVFGVGSVITSPGRDGDYKAVGKIAAEYAEAMKKIKI